MIHLLTDTFLFYSLENECYLQIAGLTLPGQLELTLFLGTPICDIHPRQNQKRTAPLNTSPRKKARAEKFKSDKPIGTNHLTGLPTRFT